MARFNIRVQHMIDEVKTKMYTLGFKDPYIDKAMTQITDQTMTNLLLQEYKNCNKCKLTSIARAGSIGDTTSPLMVVGEGPGKMELELMTPLVGISGNIFTAVLSSLKVHRERVFITNATRCNNYQKIVTPDRDDIERCLEHLLKEFEIVKPKVIIALGTKAYQAVTNDFDTKISKVRGTIVKPCDDYKLDAQVVPTWHPSYVARQKGEEGLTQARKELWMDVKKAVDLAKSIAPDYPFSSATLLPLKNQ